jgi:hypothetical protein
MQTATPVKDQAVSANVEFYRETAQKYDHYHLDWSLGPQDRVVFRPEMWCRPCFDYCIFAQPYCLRAITPEQMIASVKEVRERFDMVRSS